MAIETATYISELVATNPNGASSNVDEVDDHLQLIKSVLQSQFPNLGAAAATATAAELNLLAGASLTAAELNLLAGKSLSSSDNVLDNFPAGTSMIFYQANAPTGWTNVAGANDHALRVAPGGSGGSELGSVAFSTLFARTATDSHLLLSSESGLPSHTHRQKVNPTNNTGQGIETAGKTDSGAPAESQSSQFTDAAPTANAASGHTHDLDMRVKYFTVVFGAKD